MKKVSSSSSGRAVSRQQGRSPSNSPQVSISKHSQRLLPVINNNDNNKDDDNTLNINLQTAGLILGVSSQQGKRPYQEDEYGIKAFVGGHNGNPETHLFGLFDGHAGGKCSKQIAATLPDILGEDAQFSNNLPQAIRRSFNNANEAFLKVAERMKLHDGSTGLVALLRDKKILIANVGDCRALVLSAGRPIQMSNDQKPTSMEEQKRIANLGGTIEYCMGVARVNGILAVSRAFGNRTLRQVIRPDPEMTQRELTRDDDFLVMASDGLWDVLRNKDVCDICYAMNNNNSGPQQIAEELVNTAIARGSMDNVTCIVVRLNGYVNRMLNKEGNSKMEGEQFRGDLLLSSSSPAILTGMGIAEMNMESSYKSKNDLYRSYDETKLKDVLAAGRSGNNNSNNFSNLGNNIVNSGSSGISNMAYSLGSNSYNMGSTGYGANVGSTNLQRSAGVRSGVLNKFGNDESSKSINLTSRYSTAFGSQGDGNFSGRESPVGPPPQHSPIQTAYKRPMTVSSASRNLNPIASSKQQASSQLDTAGDISAMYGNSNASTLFKTNSFQPINSGYALPSSGNSNLFGSSNATGFLKKIGAMKDNS
jgi:protein phosphatase 1L